MARDACRWRRWNDAIMKANAPTVHGTKSNTPVSGWTNVRQTLAWDRPGPESRSDILPRTE
jgi:hypothetical protein